MGSKRGPTSKDAHRHLLDPLHSCRLSKEIKMQVTPSNVCDTIRWAFDHTQKKKNTSSVSIS